MGNAFWVMIKECKREQLLNRNQIDRNEWQPFCQEIIGKLQKSPLFLNIRHNLKHLA